MLEPDPYLFFFDLPVWFPIVCAYLPVGQRISLRDHGVRIVSATNAAGERCLPLFTDEDLGIRFAGTLDLRDCRLLRLGTKEAFLGFLADVEGMGYTCVFFDPKGKDDKDVHPYPLAKLRDVIRGSG